MNAGGTPSTEHHSENFLLVCWQYCTWSWQLVTKSFTDYHSADEFQLPAIQH